MVLSVYARQRILEHHFAGNRAPKIQKLLQAENILVSRVAVCKFLQKYKETGTIGRQEGGGRKTVITQNVKLIVEQQMVNDDETTAFQIHKLLIQEGIYISKYSALSQGFGLDIQGECLLPVDPRSK